MFPALFKIEIVVLIKLAAKTEDNQFVSGAA